MLFLDIYEKTLSFTLPSIPDDRRRRRAARLKARAIYVHIF
jgi:hypothetical protein